MPKCHKYCGFGNGKAIDEYKMFIIRKLEHISDNYEVLNGLYIIQKHILDDFTLQLELDNI